ncbi:hypothetical protein [Empedobacter brevis]|uniref:hypothetical protein n=1 Tax=Empedobacter brevis TaxID=247 RepID=UPI0023F2474E|nr:hypothetical protein [Empedobacter brevis]
MGIGHDHYLFVVDNSLIYDEETGEMIPYENGIKFISMCREQVNSSGKIIAGTDGITIAFNSLVHLDKSVLSIDLGKTIIVSNDSEGKDVRIKGSVLRFTQGLLHNRLWV